MTSSIHGLRGSSADVVEIPYDSFRNITCPEDRENDRRVYSGHVPAVAILELSTDENVRGYLLSAEGKIRRKETQVHKAIRDTLDNVPHNFSILNGGIVIVARDFSIDEKSKKLQLLKPSIINGSQTQGVLRDYFRQLQELDEEPYLVHVTFELIVTEDEYLIAETSISRNNQDDVKALSIAGRRGQLDELEEALKRDGPDTRIKKSETDVAKDFVDTEKLIQVITALMPEELWEKFRPSESGNPNKVYTYSMKAKCLKDFQDIYNKAKNQNHAQHQDFKEIYQFFLDLAPHAWNIYKHWKKHQGFQGTRIQKAVMRDQRSQIVDVQDGMVFPILSALSAFVIKGAEEWKFEPPDSFDEKELIKAAVQVYIEIAHHNPWNMGKSKPCYSNLYQISSIYRRLSGMGA